jgi:hypothetical protein
MRRQSPPCQAPTGVRETTSTSAIVVDSAAMMCKNCHMPASIHRSESRAVPPFSLLAGIGPGRRRASWGEE